MIASTQRGPWSFAGGTIVTSSAGKNNTAYTSAPNSAQAIVSAIGRNILPSAPSSVSSGRYTSMMIATANATGRTARPVTGFKGRSGKSFRARLALQQSDEGKWRVEFDEPWAREGAKPPEQEESANGAADAAAAESPSTDAAVEAA